MNTILYVVLATLTFMNKVCDMGTSSLNLMFLKFYWPIEVDPVGVECRPLSCEQKS